MAKPVASEQSAPHVPVLLAEVLGALAPLDGARIVDGTFGAGGYSRAMLEAGASVVAIDRDPSVRAFAETLAAEFPSRFSFVAGAFAELDELVDGPVDGVVLDIGVSSMQLDRPERGFSFMREGPLDMRMAAEGESAADLVNGLDEAALANLLFAYAATTGNLAVVGVLGSLYPVATVVLARWLLRERLSGGQNVGVVLALTGVVLLAAA